jgi:protein-S-isoprenylcysteine O-methyltransferase Ste14
MILVCAFHFLYVADYYFHEKAILSTMDIKHENFGWMLCWGDYPWVPFTYTLQTMYLVEHTHDLPWYATVGIVALNMAGYFLFRAVNSQKDRFRDDPEAPIWGRKPEYIRTKRGTLLLTSGYWGIARHLNYMGDIMLGLAWCLPCGFGHLLPYFYSVYFTWLLIHRQWRDDKMCKAKYGADWDEYCKKVRWKIVPYVY